MFDTWWHRQAPPPPRLAIRSPLALCCVSHIRCGEHLPISWFDPASAFPLSFHGFIPKNHIPVPKARDLNADVASRRYWFLRLIWCITSAWFPIGLGPLLVHQDFFYI